MYAPLVCTSASDEMQLPYLAHVFQEATQRAGADAPDEDQRQILQHASICLLVEATNESGGVDVQERKEA